MQEKHNLKQITTKNVSFQLHYTECSYDWPPPFCKILFISKRICCPSKHVIFSYAVSRTIYCCSFYSCLWFLPVSHVFHVTPQEIVKGHEIWWPHRPGLWNKRSVRYGIGKCICPTSWGTCELTAAVTIKRYYSCCYCYYYYYFHSFIYLP